MEELRVGIIGAGGIAAKLHLPQLQAIDGVCVDLIGGRKASRLETLRRKFNVPRSTQDYQAVVDDPDLDAIVVALPHPLHVEWGLKVLAAEKHLLMQKPLSTSLSEADEFVDAVEKTARIVLALPYSSRPQVLAAREIIQSGGLGTVSAAHCRYSHGGPEVYYAGIQEILEEKPADALWFFDADQADVGALFDMGVYAISHLVTLVGSVAAVTAKLKTVAKPTRLEDTAALLLEFEAGSLGVAETGWCDAARTAEFSVHGTRGKLVCPTRDAGLTCYRPSSLVDEDAPLTEESVDLSGYPQQNAHEHWVECIRSGRQPPLANAAMSRHVTEIMLAGLESARIGRTVEIRSRVPE